MKKAFKKISKIIVKGGILLWCKVAHRVKIEGREDLFLAHISNMEVVANQLGIVSF